MIRELVAMTRLYSRTPRLYERWIDMWAALLGGEQQLHQAITRGLDIQPGQRVLDLCCGTGRYTIPLAAAAPGARLVGLDAAPRMLKYLSNRKGARGVSLVVADARQLPFPHGAFEKVLICGALHEMPSADRAKVLAEAARVLGEGGEIMIIEPAFPEKSGLARAASNILFHPLNPERHTLRDMLREGLDHEVEAAGLQITARGASNRGFMQHILARRGGDRPPR